MANADAVVVELIADVKGFTPTTNKAANDFDQVANKIGSSADKAGASIERMSNRSAAATRNLGRQVADIGQGLATGQSPFLIMAQQSGQVADALADTGGKAAKVAQFFAGPWGAAILAAASAAGILLGDVLKLGNAVDEHVKKLKEQWRQTQAAEQADRRFAESIEGVQKATKDATKTNDEWLHGLDNSLLKIASETSLNYKNALAIRETTKARLADAIALYKLKEEEARGPGQRGEAAALTAPLYGGTVDRLQNILGAQNTEVDALRLRADQARVDYFSSEIEKAVDPLKRVSQLWDKIIEQKKKDLALSHASDAQVQASLGPLYRQRDAAIAKAQADAQAANRKPRDDGPTTDFIRPVAGGKITSPFGAKRPGEIHPGVDIAVPVGTPIRAPAAGDISYAGSRGNYGNVIVINFGAGTTGRFGHLSRFNVKPGDTVNAGDIIGYTGGAKGAEGAGNSTGPHLHYEVRRNGKAVNPLGGAFPTDATGADIAGARKTIDDAAQAELKFNKLLDETGDKLQRLFGKSADDRFAEQFRSIFGSEDPLKDSLATIGPTMRAETDAWNEENQRRQHIQEQQIGQLASLYEGLFTGGVKGIWDEFKREGLRTLALLLAKWTVAAFTKGNDGGGFGDLLKSVGTAASSMFGGGSAAPRASGGPVEAGRLYHINESAAGGRVEGFVPSTSGKVIPLGSMGAATGSRASITQNHYAINVRADNSVTPAGFAAGLARQILDEARRMDERTLDSAPARVQRVSTLGS